MRAELGAGSPVRSFLPLLKRVIRRPASLADASTTMSLRLIARESQDRTKILLIFQAFRMKDLPSVEMTLRKRRKLSFWFGMCHMFCWD